jgi:hypothetical protein
MTFKEMKGKKDPASITTFLQNKLRLAKIKLSQNKRTAVSENKQFAKQTNSG